MALEMKRYVKSVALASRHGAKLIMQLRVHILRQLHGRNEIDLSELRR